MQNKLKKLFLSSQLLSISAVTALVFWLIWGLYCLSEEGGFLYELTTDAVFYFAIVLGLFITYKKGETNIQKALLGALLIFLCNSNIEIVYAQGKYGTKPIQIMFIITFILTSMNLIGHLLQQSDHIGKKSYIFINQCNTLLGVIILSYALRQAFFTGNFIVVDVTFMMAWFFTLVLIVCIETRINEYKQLRAKAKAEDKWDNKARAKAKEIFKI